MMNSSFLWPAIVVWCGLIAWSDWTRRRIPNTLLAAALAAALIGLAFTGATPFGAGPVQCMLGAIVGLVAFLPLYILRIMGAGDVKLFATAGALLGLWALFPIWLIASVLAALHALVWVTSTRLVPHLAASRYVGAFGRLPYGAHLAAGIVAVTLRPDLMKTLAFGAIF